MSRPRKGVTFWDRVYSQAEWRDGCEVFTGCCDDDGYGRINRDGKLVRLHRAVWERDHGPIHAGKVIMHTCDNPPCINPAHLAIGTQPQNIADMDRKGRRVNLYGSQQSQAKLTETDIPDIRLMLGYGLSCEKIGAEYQVSSEAIRHIKKLRKWSHV